MDADRQERPESVPIRLTDYEWDAEIRGGLVALKGRQKFHKMSGGGIRGNVTTFTRQSRLRMFKMVATIDWPAIGKGLFITLTFPCRCLPIDKEGRKQALYEFCRSMENYLGRKVGILWRVEWVIRKSGKWAGTLQPHYHLIVFSVRYIPYEDVRKWWRRALKTTGYVRTECKRLGDKERHGIYIAKYAAKPLDSSLVNVAYRNKCDGRHWGYKRLLEIPRSPSRYYENLSMDAVLRMRDFGAVALPWYDPRFDRGFTVFGKLGEGMAIGVRQMLVDTGHAER